MLRSSLMSFRWHRLWIAGAGALLALPVAFWLLLPKPRGCQLVAPEVQQALQLRTAVQDWQREHPGAPAPDLTSPEVRRSLGPDLTFLDPWGWPYVMFNEPEEGPGGEETVVLSFGPDHIRGTLDDFRVPRASAGRRTPGEVR